MNRFARLAACALIAAAAVAAAEPSLLASAEGGLWEVSRAGQPPVKVCVASPAAALAQFEHRGARCSRSLMSEDGRSTVISYSCAGGDFGHSVITPVTRRSLRVHTQGIAGSAPFNYTFQARRVGNCGAH